MSRRAFLFAATTAALAAMAPAALAQSWPTKPITLVVPFAAGGGNDVVARALAAEMGARLGQNVLIENIPGASGSIGTLAVTTAPADGYKLLYGNITSVAINTVTMPDLAYDPIEDLDPITMVTESHMAVATAKDANITTVDELVAYLKANPGEPYGTAGAGSPQHLIGELLARAIGTELTHVPYNGGGPLTTALLGGQIKVGIGGLTNFIAHDDAGALNIVAIGSPARFSSKPDIPTLAETFPEIIGTGWGSLHAPKGTDPAILERLRSTAHEAMGTDAVKQALAGAGLEASPSTGEALNDRIKSDIALWQRLVDQGVKVTGN